mmetsp:Transcript_35144/g.88382  ORF Transcript_35144/g.88382 Transcript_35144/m.88382 type:complete len:221 (+) Transcript_35144:688-1350(+)
MSKKALMSSTSPAMPSARASLLKATRLIDSVSSPCFCCHSVKSCGVFWYFCANSFRTCSCCMVGLFILSVTACFMRALSFCFRRSSSCCCCNASSSTFFCSEGMLPLERLRIELSCCRLSSPSPFTSQPSKMESAAEFSTYSSIRLRASRNSLLSSIPLPSESHSRKRSTTRPALRESVFFSASATGLSWSSLLILMRASFRAVEFNSGTLPKPTEGAVL